MHIAKQFYIEIVTYIFVQQQTKNCDIIIYISFRFSHAFRQVFRLYIKIKYFVLTKIFCCVQSICLFKHYKR